MKVIILAGGLGTRLSEETHDKPKPMIRIGEWPILWHIIQIYAKQGFSDFVIAAGYKHEIISNWLESETKKSATWLDNIRVEVKDTGLLSHTGGRVSTCISEMSGDRFLFTYGDGVANINLNKLVEFHNKHNRIATLTAVRPPARFGHVDIQGNLVKHFGEKNQADEGWINGGFFVVNREILNYIKTNEESLELGALPKLAAKGELMAFKHIGFWQSMDTLRDQEQLSSLALSLEFENLPWLLP
jgi:glucose-1-phosphate cytidylyltransferase